MKLFSVFFKNKLSVCYYPSAKMSLLPKSYYYPFFAFPKNFNIDKFK